MLIDFGIARLFKAARKGTMIGTLGFAPPEQYQGQVDPRSDIYSLGATLHYVLTGRDPEKFPPFSFPPIRELRPEASGNFAGAIDSALAYEVNRRPPSIQEFRDMMLYRRGLDDAAAVSSRSGTADLSFEPEIPTYLPPSRQRSAVSRAVGLLVFTIVLAGAAFGGTYIYQSPELQLRPNSGVDRARPSRQIPRQSVVRIEAKAPIGQAGPERYVDRDLEPLLR